MAANWRRVARYEWNRQTDGRQPTRTTKNVRADEVTDPARAPLLYPNEAALDWYALTGHDHWDASAGEASAYANGALRSNLHRISQAVQWALIVENGPSRHATYATPHTRTLALNSPDCTNAKVAYQQLGASKHSRMLIESVGSAIVAALQAASNNTFTSITTTTNIKGGGRRNERATGCGIQLSPSDDPETWARLTLRFRAAQRVHTAVVDIAWSARTANIAKREAAARAGVRRGQYHIVVWPKLSQLLRGPNCPPTYTVECFARRRA